MSSNVTVEMKRSLLELMGTRPWQRKELLQAFVHHGFGSHNDGDVALSDWIKVGRVVFDVSNADVVYRRVVPEADALQGAAADGT